MKQPNNQRSNLPFLLWLGYVVFVIYGSLVPLRYQARSFDDAWAAFQRIPFLQLGVESRADWISNGVLYLPIGFLTVYLITQTFCRAPRWAALVTACVISVALAIGVEFTQLYFPQRTVSLNDIMAECIGSCLGALLATTKSQWFHALVDSFTKDTRRLKTLALDGYAFAYVALALFPYDFFISRPELAQKMSSDSWGWLIAGNSPRFTLAGLQLCTEVLLAIPLGLLLARLTNPKQASTKVAVSVGLLIGAAIEVPQFFMASGISQGLSVLAKAAGVWGGMRLNQHLPAWTPQIISIQLRRFTPVIAFSYGLALLEINGLLTLNWASAVDAADQLKKVHFTPFYYHYFTTEAKALFSLGVVALSYTPISALVWSGGRSPRFAFWAALFTCLVIEASKLFSMTTHADPTNLWIASIASWCTVHLLQQFSKTTFATPKAPSHDPSLTPSTTQSKAKTKLLWLLLPTSVVTYWVATFPVFNILLATALVACAAVVWVRPMWLFAIVPAALPVFDLAPWSGRFFWDEFDFLLVVVLTIGYARTTRLPNDRPSPDYVFNTVLVMVAVCFAISSVRGLMPLQWPDANAFNNYYSPFNALRIAKGAVWAFLLFGLHKRFIAAGLSPQGSFSWGMAFGLAMTVALIIGERVVFVGAGDFSNTYRVTGPFSAMHVGGAYIECFLAVATPYVIQLTLENKHPLARLTGALLLLATTYALMVTFSRNGYLAFAVGTGIVLLGSMRHAKAHWRSGLVFIGIFAAMLLVAVPIYKGDFAQSRMATVDTDMGVRQAHWADALSLREPSLATTLFGVGVGRYPEKSYWGSMLQPAAGTYRLETNDKNTYLRLGAGDPLYVEQLVSLEANQNYLLKMNIRSRKQQDNLSVSICEKWMLTSFNCIQLPMNTGTPDGGWHIAKAVFDAKTLHTDLQPIKISITYATPQSTIDVDSVQLIAEDGTDILRNGNFESGLDHWFFAADGHLQWHTKSMIYGALFDVGWLGLLALAALLSLAVARAGRNLLMGVTGPAQLAALVSFLIVGIFDTLTDTPRFLMLLLLLSAMGAHRRRD